MSNILVERRRDIACASVPYPAAMLCLGAWFALTGAAPASAPLIPDGSSKAQWVLKAENTTCALMRTGPRDAGTRFEISGSADGGFVSLLVADPAWKKDLVRSTEKGDIVFLPSSDRMEVDVQPLSVARVQGHGLAVYRLNERFFTSLKLATGFAIDVRGRRIAEATFAGAGRAIKALADCNDDLLRSWGVDPVVNASLLRKPRPVGDGGVAQWVTNGDYPDEALRRRASGTAVMRFNVGIDGRVNDCAIVVSSGDKALDRTSCAIIVRRGRYDPAIGADGKITPAFAVSSLRWIMTSG